jgi:general secretion pathway protein H
MTDRTRVDISGFTLLEILVVLVIMSLMMTLVPPLFSNVLPSLTLKSTANDIIHDLKYIRNIAILRGNKSELEIDPDNRNYYSKVLRQGEEQKIPAMITMNVSHVGLRTVEEQNPVIAFFSDGSSSGGVITLTEKERVYSIVIDWITGGISLTEGQYSEKY